jgi:hypothetical protein
MNPADRSSRPRRRRPRSPQRRLSQLAVGLGLCALGVGVLAALLQLPANLDALLLVSTAINNLIAGLTRLALALLQFVALVLLVAVALAALLALVAGAVRIVRALWPGQGAAPADASAQPRTRSSQ